MKTFYQWLAERTATQSEGFWLNGKSAVPGLSKLKPPKPITLKPPKPFRPTPPATFKVKPFTPMAKAHKRR